MDNWGVLGGLPQWSLLFHYRLLGRPTPGHAVTKEIDQTMSDRQVLNYEIHKELMMADKSALVVTEVPSIGGNLAMISDP